MVQKLIQYRKQHHLADSTEVGSTWRGTDSSEDDNNSIHTLVLIDREVDLVSSLITPLTYEVF